MSEENKEPRSAVVRKVRTRVMKHCTVGDRLRSPEGGQLFSSPSHKRRVADHSGASIALRAVYAALD
jgi:hypothetical protein